ncbi:MAG: hypothetical protein KME20_28670 [Kaiparowitsia implicata GSE-PSE-MK54-09C]|jgi:hypothetical protein|nr:hypothetical protein [Kaiparowitsia implicata GSE-PSE-MK54-09C]
MRDQYAGDVSDVLKFALLRSLASSDRKLGVAWYYAPGDDGRPDGRHLEWRDEPAWRVLDAQLHEGLSTLPARTIASLEASAIWPAGSLFHREPMPSRIERAAWSKRKREALDGADLVFLDPDNGVGAETEKHATLAEIRRLRRPGRAIVFIKFPGRNKPHAELLKLLDVDLIDEAEASRVVTLRTNVSVPSAEGSNSYVQRQRWFTIVDPDDLLLDRLAAFTAALAAISRVSARLDVSPS